MSLDAVKHVILLIFENRSFDHLLGWMRHPRFGNNPNVAGLVGDVDPATGAIENDDYENDAVGFPFQPFFREIDEPFPADLPHGRGAVADQMAFDELHRLWTMRGFAGSLFRENPNVGRLNPSPPANLRMLGPSAAPMTAFLARNYCVCDHWFAPVPTDTHPNRFMALAGFTKIDRTQGGFPEPDHDLVFDWATRNRIPWRVYSDGFSFCSLMLDRLATTLTDKAHFRRFHDLASDFQSERDFPALVLLEPQFSDDPFAPAPSDNHPPFPMGPGEGFLLQVYQALCGSEAARQRWANTMLVVYYDEHGGFFDHVPPLAIRTEPGEAAGDPRWPAFLTTGPRVPAIIASPLVEPGAVFSGNLDHTSVLRFLAERFTPGAAYGRRVAERHASGVLQSVGAVLTRDSARQTPAPPRLGPFQQFAFPSGRPALTDGQKAFLGARQRAHALHGGELAGSHPESFFVPMAG